MEIISNTKGIHVKFESKDNDNEIELAHCMIQQLLCLLRITHEIKK